MKIALLLTIIATLIICCQPDPSQKVYSQAQIDSLKISFNQHIATTEQEFRTRDWSPLTAEDKEHFEHLNYYAYDVSWRFEGPIQIFAEADSFFIHGSKEGDLRPAIPYGIFKFTRNGVRYQLQIIKIFPSKPDGQPHLFLGFWDETSDAETYGGGRYIDIEENAENYYTVDFNYAYNPYCAYSARYSCAIPPFKNRLKVAVRAGEKLFKEH